MEFPVLTFSLPGWVGPFLAGRDTTGTTVESRMRLVIDLARTNVAQGTGGPFAAAVFDPADGALVAPGVNLVTSCNLSPLHGEMVALMVAQCRLGSYDLGSDPDRPLELVTSVEPCLMCLGAVFWSGVRRLVCGARDEDARAIGFDEGPKPDRWEEEFARRGIRVVRDVLRPEAVLVLQDYLQAGGPIYNPGR